MREPDPFVCPGCYAVGEAPCSPGCIDAAIERAKIHDQETREMYGDEDTEDGGADGDE